MADEAGPRVSGERRPALILEAQRMRVYPLAAREPLRRVARRTVALGMAGHTRVQVSLGLPRVVLHAPGRRRPLDRRRVEPPAGHAVTARHVARDAHAPVAVGAERLLLVAAHAA